jgi:hypothetical protein
MEHNSLLDSFLTITSTKTDLEPSPSNKYEHIFVTRAYQFRAGIPGENRKHTSSVVRATDVACSLRRVPAGFHVIVEVDGSITQTSNKPVSTEKDAVEWDEEILLYVILCRMTATFVE